MMCKNKFSLPALSILDEKLEPIDALFFYQSPEHLRPIIEFIGSNSYKSKSFNDFMQEYLKEPVKKTSSKSSKK